MNHILRQRIDYLLSRLRAQRGNRAVLIAEIVKAYNSREQRRASDVRILGWTIKEPQS